MPAADELADLYDFEDTIAAAFLSYLQTELPGKTFQIARNNSQQAPPCVLIRAEHESAANGLETDQKYFTADGNISKDRHFVGRLITTIRTHRQTDQSDDDHADLRKRVRAALYDCVKATGINAELTHHSIRSIYEDGNSHEIDEDEGFDDTVITWPLSYVIKDDSWPA